MKPEPTFVRDAAFTRRSRFVSFFIAGVGEGVG